MFAFSIYFKFAISLFIKFLSSGVSFNLSLFIIFIANYSSLDIFVDKYTFPNSPLPISSFIK
jgi:hypothetical protein